MAPPANVPALVLIYDIRGFTAASKRVGTADLGAFATAAHRQILDLFASRPPSFVKNLGDGHLLVWESPEGLTPELLDPVMAAARKARGAFSDFVAAQGALGARLPHQVGLGVAFGETFKSDDYYGVAMNLAARLQNEARPEGMALSDTVFEAAARRDARLREEFRRVRVSLKGLGSTTLWVKRPFSWKRALRPFAPWALAAAALLAYVALADAGLKLPGAEAIRRGMDARGLSVFRAPHSDETVRARAKAWRGRYIEFFDGARLANGRIRVSSIGQSAGENDSWSTAQAVTALLRAPEADAVRLRRALVDLEGLFAPDVYVERDGIAYGWASSVNNPATGAEPALWAASALALVLGRRDVLRDEERPLWRERLRKAQRAANLYHPRKNGGWNQFPHQESLDHHSPYTSALALLALLETWAAKEAWDGESAELPLRQTAAWLLSRFDPAGLGWRGTPYEGDRVSPGLTLQIFAELLRAEETARVELPAAILDAIPRHLENLAGKKLAEAYDAGENHVRYQSHLDRAESVSRWSSGQESVNFLWHPWGVDCAWRWLARAAREAADPADVTRVRRALGHLVVDLGPDAFRAATSGFTFVASETLYGLSALK